MLGLNEKLGTNNDATSVTVIRSVNQILFRVLIDSFLTIWLLNLSFSLFVDDSFSDIVKIWKLCEFNRNSDAQLLVYHASVIVKLLSA